MIESFKLFPLLLCLPLLHSIAQASLPSQKDFEFLEPFNDTRLVENRLELTGSIAGVSLSTLLNLGIWWGVCKTAGIVSGLASRQHLAGQDPKGLDNPKMDFCLQLAPVVTTAEVVLAGQVSPWPLERLWWKPLYFAGAGMTAYAAYTVPETRKLIPVTVLTYLTSEAISRTAASASSALILREINVGDIATDGYVYGEYQALSLFTGIMAGAIIYETMIHKGFRPAKAALAFAVSTVIAGILSGIVSVSTIGMDNQPGAVAGAGAVIATVAGSIAVVGAGVVAVVGAGAGAGAGALVGAVAGAVTAAVTVTVATTVTGVIAGAGSEAGIIVGAGAGAGAVAVAGAGVGVGILSTRIISNNPLINVGVTMIPALSFAVVNSLSNYAVYGDPLEEGFSETARTQWKKFYAPLDYLSTLFN